MAHPPVKFDEHNHPALLPLALTTLVMVNTSADICGRQYMVPDYVRLGSKFRAPVRYPLMGLSFGYVTYCWFSTFFE